MRGVMTALAAGAAMCAGAAGGQFSYDESVSGDLTDDRFAPFELSAAPGSNVLSGTVVTGDRDYFRFTVPAGFELSALNLLDYDSPDFAAFLGVQSGSSITVDPDNPDPADLLGYALYGPLEEGTDLLPTMGTAFGAIGFSGALPAGEYSFWNQQTGVDLTGYTLEFVITVVPAPAGLGVLAAAGAIAGRRRR
ncbi:MAG: hypothetical protein ACTS22_07860 [Phycisphaerales bacterium]